MRNREGGQSRPVGHTNFFIDVVEVDLHCPFRQAQSLSNFFVRKSFGHVAHHLTLAFSKNLSDAFRLQATADLTLECRVDDLGRKPLPPIDHLSDTSNE